MKKRGRPGEWPRLWGSASGDRAAVCGKRRPVIMLAAELARNTTAFAISFARRSAPATSDSAGSLKLAFIGGRRSQNRVGVPITAEEERADAFREAAALAGFDVDGCPVYL